MLREGVLVFERDIGSGKPIGLEAAYRDMAIVELAILNVLGRIMPEGASKKFPFNPWSTLLRI